MASMEGTDHDFHMCTTIVFYYLLLDFYNSFFPFGLSLSTAHELFAKLSRPCSDLLHELKLREEEIRCLRNDQGNINSTIELLWKELIEANKRVSVLENNKKGVMGIGLV